MLEHLWYCVKKASPAWLSIASLVIAFWPLPSDWNSNFTISVNARLFLAVIILFGLFIWILIYFSIRIYNGAIILDERVISVEKSKYNNVVTYHVFINYNPSYKSASIATVMLVEPKHTEGGVRIDERRIPLCNGNVIVNDKYQIQVLCRLEEKVTKNLDNEIMNYDRKRSDHSQLVVHPFYTPVQNSEGESHGVNK